MNNFEWCKYCFEKGWAKVEQLKIWVVANKITDKEFKTITGVEYVSQ